MARRAPGTLRPLDDAILEAALRLHTRDIREFHGYQLSRELGSDVRYGHTTLYRALDALETMGLLESRWENHHDAAQEGRPSRCYYKVTGLTEPAYRTWPRVATSRSLFQPHLG